MLILLILMFAARGVASGEEVTLTRAQCREMALEHSQRLRVAENRQAQSVLQEKIARAAQLPSLSASGLYFYSPDHINYTLPSGSLFDQDGEADLPFDFELPDAELNIALEGVTLAGVELEQAVYAGGKIRNAIQLAETGSDIAVLDVERNTAEVLVLADSVYFRYIAVREKREAAVAYRELLEELVASLEDSLEEGMITRNELLKARVKLNEAILMVQKAGSGLELARMDLCRVTGLPLETAISATESLTDEAPDLSTPEAHGHDPSGRPEYRMLDKAIDVRGHEVRMARADMFPRVGFQAGYNYFGGLELNEQSSEEFSLSLMASVKVPIFNWGEKRNKVSRARLQQEAAQMEKREAEKLLRLDIARARLQLEDASTRLALTEQALTQAEENLETSSDRYDEGMEPLVDLLEAQANWAEAKSDHIEARASVALQKTMYKKALGKLADEQP